MCYLLLHIIQLYILIIFMDFFFFNDTATTEIYTLSLHDALPVSIHSLRYAFDGYLHGMRQPFLRSEEHTSELQSRRDLVCRLLLEKKKIILFLATKNSLTPVSFLPTVLIDFYGTVIAPNLST